jgi:hypothetical protein
MSLIFSQSNHLSSDRESTLCYVRKVGLTKIGLQSSAGVKPQLRPEGAAPPSSMDAGCTVIESNDLVRGLSRRMAEACPWPESTSSTCIIDAGRILIVSRSIEVVASGHDLGRGSDGGGLVEREDCLWREVASRTRCVDAGRTAMVSSSMGLALQWSDISSCLSRDVGIGVGCL